MGQLATQPLLYQVVEFQKQVSISQAAGQQVTVTGFTGGNKWYHPGSAVGDKIPVPGSITMDIAPGEGIISGSLTFDRVITSAKITDDYCFYKCILSCSMQLNGMKMICIITKRKV